MQNSWRNVEEALHNYPRWCISVEEALKKRWRGVVFFMQHFYNASAASQWRCKGVVWRCNETTPWQILSWFSPLSILSISMFCLFICLSVRSRHSSPIFSLDQPARAIRIWSTQHRKLKLQIKLHLQIKSNPVWIAPISGGDSNSKYSVLIWSELTPGAIEAVTGSIKNLNPDSLIETVIQFESPRHKYPNI